MMLKAPNYGAFRGPDGAQRPTSVLADMYLFPKLGPIRIDEQFSKILFFFSLRLLLTLCRAADRRESGELVATLHKIIYLLAKLEVILSIRGGSPKPEMNPVPGPLRPGINHGGMFTEELVDCKTGGNTSYYRTNSDNEIP
jgi:hypothetical protein